MDGGDFWELRSAIMSFDRGAVMVRGALESAIRGEVGQADAADAMLVGAG